MKEEFIVKGYETFGQVSQKSVGIQLYDSLRNNLQKEIIDATNDVKISYEELLESSCSLAKWFKQNGYKRNDIVSVCSENSIHFLKPVVAAFYSGIVVTCMNHTYSENELLHCLTLTEPKIAFCSLSTYKNFLSLYVKRKIPFVKKLIILEHMDKDPEIPRTKSFTPIDVNTKEQTAVILYSSGTTGLSKAVMLSHDNINIRENHAHDPRLFSVDCNNYNLISVPFYHTYGFMFSLGQVFKGSTFIFLQRFEELKYLETIEKYRLKTLLLVPPLMVLLAKSPNVDKFDLTSVQEIACGAAAMSKELENSVKQRFPHIKTITQAYGMTETTLRILGFPLNFKNKFGSCGIIMPNSQAKIRDPETGKNLGPNKVGELCIKSGLVMQGYYKNPEATKATITDDGWLMTGDLAYYDEDEYFFIVDRLKELIKFKGFQVAPAEIEALLLKHPKIYDAAVVGLPDESVGEKALAFVVKRENVSLEENEILKYVADNVSYAKRLHGGVRFVSAVPKSPSGKILRRELRKQVCTSKSKL